MKLKKMMSVILAACLFATGLTGCASAVQKRAQTAGQDAGKSSSEMSESAVMGTESITKSTASMDGSVDPSKLEPVTLTWYVIGTPQDDQQTVTDAINKVLKEKLNTTLDIKVIDFGSYDEKMNVIIATNEQYDMCYTSSWTNNFVQNAAKGAFYPLDDLLNKYGQDIMAQVPKSYWKAAQVNGKTYGVVNYQISALVRGIAVQKTLADKYGFDPSKITKLADMEPFFAKVKAGESDISEFCPTQNTLVMPELFDNSSGFTMDYIAGNSYYPYAVKVGDDKLQVFNAVETPEFMNLCKTMRSWYEKGYIKKDAASVKDYISEVKGGEYASFPQSAGPGSEQSAKLANGFDSVIAQYAPAYVNTGSIQAALTGISRNSKNPERAMMVLNYIFKDKALYNLFCYGIEGKHYTKVNDYSVKPITDSGYTPVNQWCYGSWFNAMLLDGQAKDHWDQWKKINEDADLSPLFGFVYNSDNMKSQNSQINALMGEYIPGLLTGTIDPDTKVPELIKKLKNAGIEDVMKDAQTQIDSWKTVK